MASPPALGPLELKIVGLFDEKSAFSVAEVRQRLSEPGREPAYTTVMTVLSRLHDKGVLAREQHGKHFVYSLAKSTTANASSMLERIHRTLFKTVRLRPLLALLEEDDVSTEELRALRKLVDQKLKGRAR